MIIIPVGMAATIRRVPAVTVTIIGLCVAIWIATEPTVRRQEAEIGRVRVMAWRLEKPFLDQFYLDTSNGEHPEQFFRNRERLEDFRARIKSGEGWPSRNRPGGRFLLGFRRNGDPELGIGRKEALRQVDCQFYDEYWNCYSDVYH